MILVILIEQNEGRYINCYLPRVIAIRKPPKLVRKESLSFYYSGVKINTHVSILSLAVLINMFANPSRIATPAKMLP